MRRVLYDITPPMSLFGPLFVVIAIPGMSFGWTLFAIVGAKMSGFALLAVLLRQREIDARLDAMARDSAQGDQAETMLVPRRS